MHPGLHRGRVLVVAPAVSSSSLPPASRWHRLTQGPVARFFWAIPLVGLPFVLANVVSKLWMTSPELLAFRNPFKTVVLLLAYAAFVRWVERRSVDEGSLPGAGRELVQGFGWGLGVIGTAVALLAMSGGYTVSGWGSPQGALTLLQLHVFVAVLEELLFRGLLFRLLEGIVGTWGALLVSTLLFGLAHGANPGANAITLSALGGLSVCLTLAFVMTRRLWLCVGLHWGWNFAQGGLFGLPVSGTQVAPGALAASTSGPTWLTGGAFGLEASVLTLALTALLCLHFGREALRRGHWRAPSWASARSISVASPSQVS